MWLVGSAVWQWPPSHQRCLLCPAVGQTLVPAMPRVTETPHVPTLGVTQGLKWPEKPPGEQPHGSRLLAEVNAFPGQSPAVPRDDSTGMEQPQCPRGGHIQPLSPPCPQTLWGRRQPQGQGRAMAGGTRDRLGGLRGGTGGPHLPSPSPSPSCSPPRAAACGTPSHTQTAPLRCCRLRRTLRDRRGRGVSGLGGAQCP